MARTMLRYSNARPAMALMRFAEIYSGRLSALPLGVARAAAPKPGSVTVSTAAGLRCAKGAMMALGLEAAAAVATLCLYAVWHH